MKPSTSFYLILGYIGYAVAVDLGIRPTRAQCRSGPRPCAWLGCRHHIATDDTEFKATGSYGLQIIPVALLANKDKDPKRRKTKGGRDSSTALRDPEGVDYDALLDHLETHGSCALDIAEQEAPITLSEIGKKFCLTRERVRQHEMSALRKLQTNGGAQVLQEFMDGSNQ